MAILADIGYDHDDHDRMVESVRLAKHDNISDLIAHLAQSWMKLYRLQHSQIINQGACEDFALDVETLWPTAQAIWDDQLDHQRQGSHCIVFANGRFYDAESPNGEDHWINLPYFQRMTPT